MSPKVFIIIPTWNNWSDIFACLPSIQSGQYQHYQVVIVDNGSDEAKQIDDERVKVIRLEKNLGFVGGNNAGIQYALENNAKYILLLNDDTIVKSDFLSEMMEAAESDKRIGIVGAKIYFFSEKNRLWHAGGKINWLYNKGTMRGYNELDEGRYDQPPVQDVDYVTGCCLLIKKEVVEKIGLLPKEYFAYYEDADWCLKARKSGWRCVFAPKAVIWHKGSKTSKEASPGYIYYHVRNGLIFAKKFAPWYIRPLVFGDTVWCIKKQFLKMIFMPAKRKWAKYILLGIKDFYLKKWGKNENWY